MNSDGLIAAACGVVLVLGYTHLKPFQGVEAPPPAAVVTPAADVDDQTKLLRRELDELKSNEEKRLKQATWDEETRRIEANRRLSRQQEERRQREEELAEARARVDERLAKVKKLEEEQQRLTEDHAQRASARSYSQQYPPPVFAPRPAPVRAYIPTRTVVVAQPQRSAPAGMPSSDPRRRR